MYMTYLSILIRNCVCIEIKQQVNYVVYNEINVDVFKRLKNLIDKSLIFVRSTGKIFSKILTWKSSVSDKTLTTVPDICESIICL